MRREDDGGSKMGKNAKRKADVTRKRSLWPAEEVAMTAAKAASQKKREDKKRSDKKAKMDKNWAKRQGLSQVEDPSSDDDGNDDENDDSDEDEQLAPEPSLPRAPVTTTTTTTTTTSTAQQGRSAPVALVQVHMSEVDKELAAHRVSLSLYRK